MIFHTYKTITIGRFAELVELKDFKLVKRFMIPLPQRMLESAFKRLMNGYNSHANKEKLEELVESDAGKIKALHKINYFESLEKAVAAWLISQDEKLKKVVFELYKLHYKRDPENDNDYVKITKDRELLILKYKQVFPDDIKVKENKKEPDFESYLIQIELALAPVTIRDKKLYLLPKYIDKAIKSKVHGRD